MAENDLNKCRIPVPPRAEAAVSAVKKLFGDSADLNAARAEVSGIKCAVLTLEGMVSTADLTKILFEPMRSYNQKNAEPADVFKYLGGAAICSTETAAVNYIDEAAERLCSGYAVVFIHGMSRGLAFSAQGFKARSVGESDSEPNIKGTREALNDSLRTSMSIIRRRIKSPRLRFELIRAGKIANIELCIVYLEGKTPKGLVDETRKSLEKIDSDLVLTSGGIIPYMTGSSGTFFSGVSTTERPDVLCSKINEGRIAVLIDGVPFAVTAPALFIENFQVVDDYAERSYFATFQRFIRFAAFFISALLPGLYVAAAVFHPEVLSRSLLLNLIASEERTPYPLVAEMIIVIVMFEILREAGIRLPRAVGGAVSIVGGLVIGDAAVSSGIISAPLLIIIGITATSAFVVPGLNSQITILRVLNVAAGGFFGFFGIALLGTAALVNACATDSYAVPYTAPLTPFTLRAMKDAVLRLRKAERGTKDTVESLRGSLR